MSNTNASLETSPTQSFWDSYMKSYDYLENVESYTAGLSDIADAACVNSGDKILDAGSGTGNLSLLLKSRGAQVLSLDFSRDALEIHRKKDSYAETMCHSLEKPIPLEDKTFDRVCCASVLFSLSRNGCRMALNEFHRLLKPGGMLIVTVAAPSKRNTSLLKRHVTAQGVSGILRLITQAPAICRILYYNRRLQKLGDWQGYHRFTESELETLCTQAGFKEVNVRKTYAASFYLLSARK